MRNYLAAYWILLWVIYQVEFSGAKNPELDISIFDLQESSFASYVANCPNNVDITINKNTANQRTISGLACVTRNKNVDYHVFQGIPFAQPPVGDLRFRDTLPKTIKDLPDPYNATAPRSECIRTVNKMPSIKTSTATYGEEDCLYLNIFRPVKGKSKLPVVVWIHGGSFLFGIGNIPVADSEGFMENQVMLVSINYRLGVFGFLCTEDDASPGNYGLKDQIAALQWIQDNIAAFGGDPKGVTVFGESAGGASVLYLMQSPKAAGLFQGAISDSASSLCLWALSNNPLAITKAVASHVGIQVNHHPQHIVDSLRKVDSVKLSKKAAGIRANSIAKGLPWAPCVDNDVVPGHSYKLLQKGIINKVPVLIGFNSQEARDTSVSAKNALSALKKVFLSSPKNFVPINLNITGKQTHAAGEQIKKEYQIDGSKGITAFTNYASEDLFVRAINRTVQLLSQYVPVYFYEMGYTGGDDFHNYSPEVPGVAHAEELQFLFNYIQDPNTDRYINSTIVSDFMLTLWTNFAKQSDPTPSPVNKITWKRADSRGLENLTYLYIDVEPKLLYGLKGKTMTFWDELYDKYQNGTGTTF